MLAGIPRRALAHKKCYMKKVFSSDGVVTVFPFNDLELTPNIV